MKKFLSITTSVIVVSAILAFGSCKKDDDPVDNCLDLVNKVSAAATAYTSNPSSDNCNAYKTAITNYFNGCDAISDEDKTTYQAIIDGMSCD